MDTRHNLKGKIDKMLTRSGQYVDDLIKLNALRKTGTTPDITGLAAAHNAEQEKDVLSTGMRGAQLGLRRRALDEDRERFDESMKLGREMANKSNLLAGFGLGLGAVNSFADMRRSSALEKQRQKMAGFYSDFEKYLKAANAEKTKLIGY